MNEVTEDQLEDIEALFVQTAGRLSSDGQSLITLQAVSPSTIYFADRPKREVGHMSTSRFVDLWGDGDNSFATDPPNAVLSFAEPADRTPEEVVVTIRNPHADGDSLTYQVNVLDGKLPASTGPCAPFIDPFGRPLSPASAAGMHRRGRRRMRRRQPCADPACRSAHAGSVVPVTVRRLKGSRLERTVSVPGGVFLMGSDDHHPEERPARQEQVAGFMIDEHPVTNAEFRRFVQDTDYVTTAETAPPAADFPDADPSQLLPGSPVFRPTAGPVPLNDWRRWWHWTPGAYWRAPEGRKAT